MASLANQRAEGTSWTSLSPITALSTNGVAGGVVGLGLLMAFWSWVGFESTAIYGEESKDPKRIVPRATMIAVIGIGVFYTFVVWGIVVGNGPTQGRGAERRGTSPFDLIYAPTEQFVGTWAVRSYEWLVFGGCVRVRAGDPQFRPPAICSHSVGDEPDVAPVRRSSSPARLAMDRLVDPKHVRR